MMTKVLFSGDVSIELSFIFITINRLIHLNDLFSNQTDSVLKLILKIRSPFVVIEFNSYRGAFPKSNYAYQ